MTQFRFWRNGMPLDMNVEDGLELPHHFTKMVIVDDVIFLLDSQKSVWKGDYTVCLLSSLHYHEILPMNDCLLSTLAY